MANLHLLNIQHARGLRRLGILILALRPFLLFGIAQWVTWGEWQWRPNSWDAQHWSNSVASAFDVSCPPGMMAPSFLCNETGLFVGALSLSYQLPQYRKPSLDPHVGNSNRVPAKEAQEKGAEVLYGIWPLVPGVPQVFEAQLSARYQAYVDALAHSYTSDSQDCLVLSREWGNGLWGLL